MSLFGAVLLQGEEEVFNDNVEVELRLRNTFLECCIPEPPIRRTQSAPECVVSENVPVQVDKSPQVNTPTSADNDVDSGSGCHTEQSGSKKKPGPLSLDGQCLPSGDEVLEAGRRNPGAIWDLARQNNSTSMTVQNTLRSTVRALGGSESTRASALHDLNVLLQDFQEREYDAALHPSANYVVQLMLELAPPHMTEFVPEAFLGRAVRLAKNPIGCRTLMRVFRFQLKSGSLAAEKLAAEIVLHSASLARHDFANYVIQELLEQGFASQRHDIAAALIGSNQDCSVILDHAAKPHSSCVLEKALKHCCREDIDCMVELLSRCSSVQILLESKSGRRVARAVCEVLPSTDERKCWLQAFLPKPARRCCKGRPAQRGKGRSCARGGFLKETC